MNENRSLLLSDVIKFWRKARAYGYVNVAKNMRNYKFVRHCWNIRKVHMGALGTGPIYVKNRDIKNV